VNENLQPGSRQEIKILIIQTKILKTYKNLQASLSSNKYSFILIESTIQISFKSSFEEF
jgi:hypothetical protein